MTVYIDSREAIRVNKVGVYSVPLLRQPQLPLWYNTIVQIVQLKNKLNKHDKIVLQNRATLR